MVNDNLSVLNGGIYAELFAAQVQYTRNKYDNSRIRKTPFAAVISIALLIMHFLHPKMCNLKNANDVKQGFVAIKYGVLNNYSKLTVYIK